MFGRIYANFEKNLTVGTLAINFQSWAKKIGKKFISRRILKIFQKDFRHRLGPLGMYFWPFNNFFVSSTICSTEFFFSFGWFWGGHYLKIHISPGGHRGLKIFGVWKGMRYAFKMGHVSTWYPTGVWLKSFHSKRLGLLKADNSKSRPFSFKNSHINCRLHNGPASSGG